MIVGFGPGGGTDIVARVIAQSFQQKFGQPFVVENRPGAAGALAADAVAKSPADGHTLYMMNNGHIIAGVMAKSLPYDTLGSFEPIGQVASASLMIVTHPNFPANSIKELVTAAKAAPGKFTYATTGVGSTQHFTGELFKQVAGIDLLHIPYKTSPAGIGGVLGKQVDLLVETVSAVLGQVQTKQLKALAVTGLKRFPVVPDIPTAAESGVAPGYEVVTWYGIIARRGTPASVVGRLNKALNETLAEPEVREKLMKLGVLASGGSPAEFGSHMKNEFVRWGKVRAAAKIPQI
jgi:tripartite-type tricarboxylate transporter receptor subunit TctC